MAQLFFNEQPKLLKLLKLRIHLNNQNLKNIYYVQKISSLF